MTVATVDPYKLYSLGRGQQSLIADEGRFRAVLYIDSDAYKIGEDWPTTKEAQAAIMVACGFGCTFQIHDDQGKAKLDEDGNLI